MAERYTQLSKDTSVRYSVGCPVIIEASALLKDHQINRVLAQIKLKNLSDKTLLACKVRIKAYEPGGKEVECIDSFNYLDLTVKCGESFGSKNPAILPNDGTRIIKVFVIEAVFSDGTVWNECESEWKTLPDATPIDSVVGSEIKEQFRLESGISNADFAPQITDDLFVCPCGEIYKTYRSACPKCGKSRETLLSLWDVDALKKNWTYDLARSKMIQNDILYYETAINAFRTISGWKDADEQIVICQSKIEEIREKEEADRLEAERRAQKAKEAAEKRAKTTKKIAAIVTPIVVSCIAFVILLTTVIIPDSKYNTAIDLYNAGKYDEAITAFNVLNGYKDSEAQITKCETAIADVKYTAAVDLYNAGKYDEAITAFNALNGYKDSEAQITKCEMAINDVKYNAAVDLYNAGKYDEAIATFTALDSFKDSAEKADECLFLKQKAGLTNVTVGSTIKFGFYEQDNNSSNGKEEIEWKVLAVEGNKALIISQYALDCKRYDNSNSYSVTWKECSLRTWLHGTTFYGAAFGSYHQKMIVSSTVTADKNPSYSTSPGNNTTDKVFLLSITEVKKYFSSDEARKCAPTDYAKAQGAHTSSNYSVDGKDTCWWWVRSPGGDSDHAANVNLDGSVDYYGTDVGFIYNAIRPAMWINIGD